jgi:uncharacterized protein (TIGR03437 family)
MAFDSQGSLYFSEEAAFRVRKVDTAGIISTAAGNGLYRFSGDGGPARLAALNFPAGLTVDQSAFVYVADSGGNRIRRIDPHGKIDSFAGDGSYGRTTEGSPPTPASVGRPRDVVAGSDGAIFYLDDFLGVRRIDRSGRISTVSPVRGWALALNAQGELHVATREHQVVRLSSSGGVEVIAGTGQPGYSGDGGPAVNAMFNNPWGLVFDASGNLYVSDHGNHRVRQIAAGGIVRTFAGTGVAGLSGDNGPPEMARLRNPRGLVLDSAGSLFIADSGNGVVRRVADGVITTFAGNGVPPSAEGTRTTLAQPRALAVDGRGYLYIATQAAVYRVTASHAPAKPVFTAAGVTNAASFRSDVVAGSIATLFGTGLSTGFGGIVVATSLPLTPILLGTYVTLNDSPAPLFAVAKSPSSEQINLQVPWESAGQASARVVVVNNGATSETVTVPLRAALPGVFTTDGATGVVLHADNQLVSANRPAERGEVVVVYATGLGAVTNTPATGAAAPSAPLAETVAKPSVTVGGVAAEVVFSGLTPGFVGLYQVNIRIPDAAPAGSADLIMSQAGQSSAPVKIAVR